MYLIFDTETTGLPRDYNAPLTDFDNWPRMVQIAWQLHDKDGTAIEYKNYIVKPEGFTIPFNSEQIHGISTAKALAEGLPLVEVMAEFSKAVERANYLAGHNIEFDLNICGAEYLRIAQKNILTEKKAIDTKDESTDYCAIPGGRGGKFKWPKLEELHRKLFNKGFSEAHNACADVEATTRCFFELCRLGVIKRDDIAITQAAMLHLDEIAPLILNSLNSKDDSHATVVNTNVTETTTQNVVVKNVQFSHLHNHSQFSVLQATTAVKALIAKAAEYNCPAVALTDQGNMYGAFLFWKEIDGHNKKIKEYNASIDSGATQGEPKHQLKAIIGCELNVCKDRHNKKVQDNGYTQVLLAKNKEGYQNLAKLSSIGFLEGSYYVPRIDKECLVNYTTGLIATTGSLTSEIPSLILNVGETQAEEAFQWYLKLFGDDFYVELNRHNLREEDHVNTILMGFATKYNVKYFAANNNYYLDKKGAKAHDVLLCVKDGEKVSTPIGKGRDFRFGFANDEFYFKSPQEMSTLFVDMPEAISTTQEIVDKIETYKLGRDILLPKFKIPEEFIDERDNDPNDDGKGIRGENGYLAHLTWVGAAKRYPEMTPEIKERIDFELATIIKMGFPGYFLIVSDFTTEARRLGVSVGPGRGSAAGSAIAYCLGITNVDPIKYDLLFERFLNPDRISMPDIDIDFDDEGRASVIDYVIKKYGTNQVAQIITYGTMGGKSAIKDAARALDLPLEEANKLAKLFPENPAASLRGLLKVGGIEAKLLEKLKERKEHLEQAEVFIKIAQGTDAQAETLRQALEIEGSVRNTGTHACGVIITPDDITKYVPIAKAKDSDMLVTQFDNSVAESAGLLKMDFLGLRTLTVIKDALTLIKQRFKIDIDIDNIPLDDPKTYAMLQRGETNGIFQFESAGMQKYLKELKPDAFSDLIAMNALYRPGPIAYIPSFIKRKHGKEEVVYDLLGMDEYLKETHGITVYQEQVMRLSQKLANFTKGDADVLRKAMGKKDRPMLDKLKPQFLDGCKANNHDLKVADKVWTDWEAFASYAFNKSHSTCYAFVAFQTAYLKANYPAEFMASTLNHSGAIEKITFFMEECKAINIPVLGPDVNESQARFSVTPKGVIRFGLGAIKGVGENAIQEMITQRNAEGAFKSPFDIAKRTTSKTVTKKSYEALAYGGAFDCFENIHRAQYFNTEKEGTSAIEKIVKFANSNAEDKGPSLFDEDVQTQLPEPVIAPCEPWGNLEKLRYEKEVVGMYLSGHPLDTFKLEMQKFCNTPLNSLKELDKLRNKELTFAGIVTSVNHRTTKTGKPFGILMIEDFDNATEIALFGQDYMKFKHFLIPEMFLHIKAKAEPKWNTEDLGLVITHIELLDDIRDKLVKKLTLQVNLNVVDEVFVTNLKAACENHLGQCALEVEVYDEETKTYINLTALKLKVNPTNDLMLTIQQFATGVNFEINKSKGDSYFAAQERVQAALIINTDTTEDELVLDDIEDMNE
ncbi:MAG: DNA polymerase III subunit alpha [Bacteroidia bacterium]|nr:DNA polymerase III subunit alpha [Bacteroidia bacterium]